ncbi:glycoside hydrolase family 24 protein [Aquipseudomonas alcaligenes]|uniref:Glycoside hydrolase family 104 protein n=1 Tax=Aquipseudomonas alcaligenes TaxID=43263 RepID=A0AA42N497_AQUAC|nr:glycoside hydrolase family 104 protein [Pseudomonas alcaligenes]MDH1056825.1 glycoside hydrolase family 104 protein [Pseudomonas alcaligenes]
MSTGLLEQRANYPDSQYDYGYGGSGSSDSENDGRKDIDCSHLLHLMLKDAGYSIPYRTTSQLNIDTTHFDTVALANVQPGDIALWSGNGLGHTGVVETIGINRDRGEFFGSQDSTGPKSARFGVGAPFWPMPTKYLRPKPEFRAGAQTTPPSPTPTTAPTVDKSKLTINPTINLQYPIRNANGQQYSEAEELFALLEKESSGHYLLGNHNFWHGGIHFSEKSVPHCKVDQPIRCIADGEVIAYRLNRRYLQSEFKGLAQSTNLQYSTSFCLVRHTYESPQRVPEKQEKPKVDWAGSRISLSCARYGRDIADVKLGESGNFEALMPTATELQILEVQDSVRSGYHFASAKIISGELIGTNRDGHPSTRATGETIWFAALDKNGNPVKDKNNHEIFKILSQAPAEKKKPAPAKPDRNKLNFYSLYMHLLPFEAFQETESAFKRQVKVKAQDLNVRSSGNLTSEPLGLISVGSLLEILTTEPAHRKTPEDTTVYELAQAKIVSGSVRKAGKQTAEIGTTIWLALSMTEENKPTKSFVDEVPKHTLTRPRYWKGKVIARAKSRITAFQNPDDEESKRIGLIAENSTLEYHTDSLKKVVRAGQEKTMAKCSIASGGLWDRQLCPAFVWVCIDETLLELRADSPTEFDKVVSVSIPIKTGDPISYFGLYETPASINGGKNSHHQMHFEIFTDDKNLDKFLRNEAEIRDGKQYLLLPQGTEVHNKNILTSNQLFPSSTASRLTREHAVELNKCPIQKDEKGQEWYSVTLYDNAQTISGLVKKPNSSTPSSPEVITQHDWKKLGFRIVQENNPDADGFLDPEDMPEFFQELYREIDQLGDKNGKVTPTELQSALRDPALRERWSKLIAYHPTEWQAKSNEPKWRVLEDLLRENYEAIKKQSGNSNIQLINNLLNSTRELFRHEKERIDNLVFWNELEGATQVTLPKQVYHFHPVGFINNLQQNRSPRLEEARVRAFLRMLRVGEGTIDEDGYGRLFGGQSFIKDFNRDFSDHPRISITKYIRSADKEITSSAAGAYQVMGYNWDDDGQVKIRAKYQISDFSPRSQDRYCVLLIKLKRKALDDILSGRLREATSKCRKEWASLPDAGYNQPTVSWESVVSNYEKFLEEELSRKSDLAVEIGGLNDIIE